MKKAFIIIILVIIAFATFLFIYFNKRTSKQSGGVYYSSYTKLLQNQDDFIHIYDILINWFSAERNQDVWQNKPSDFNTYISIHEKSPAYALEERKQYQIITDQLNSIKRFDDIYKIIVLV